MQDREKSCICLFNESKLYWFDISFQCSRTYNLMTIVFINFFSIAKGAGYMAVPFRRSKLLSAFLALNLFISTLDFFWLVLD